jgi:hypothetical protein
MNSNKFKEAVVSYLKKSYTGVPGHYTSCIGGHETLYASCFSLMIYHYLGELSTFDSDHLKKWTSYILDFQDKNTGYFIGPEIFKGRLLSDAHSREHLSEHLTVHVLPALKILGVRPSYSLSFAHRYIDINYLSNWLAARDWRKAWIEGNNLLFVGQLLTFLYEEENIVEAKKAVKHILDWLDKQIDSTTGLWGTNGFCDVQYAIYGAYHQLILYYYWNRKVSYMTPLVDAVLSIQYMDGGFSISWGGALVKMLTQLISLSTCTKG